jgi:hypothetical protein
MTGEEHMTIACSLTEDKRPALFSSDLKRAVKLALMNVRVALEDGHKCWIHLARQHLVRTYILPSNKKWCLPVFLVHSAQPIIVRLERSDQKSSGVTNNRERFGQAL